MEWVKAINSAIAYMEDHLTEEIPWCFTDAGEKRQFH